MGAKTPRTSDRRVAKTHRALREALIALMTERGWDDFTVQDLCDRADIGRSTFYMHFADKEDVLTGGFDEFRKGMQAQIAGSKTHAPPFAFARAVIEHVFQQRRAFRALLGKGSGHVVVRRFADLLADMAQDELAGIRGAKQTKSAASRFVAGGFLALLTFWLESEPTLEPLVLQRLFDEMAAPVADVVRRSAAAAPATRRRS